MGAPRIAVAFGALAVLTLSGCAEGKSASLPSAASSPRVTSARTLSTSVGGRANVPPEARLHTRESAEAFARYYLEMVNVALRKPNPAVLDGLGDSGCLFCRNMQKEAENLRSQGRNFDGAALRVESIEPLGGDWDDGVEAFAAEVQQLPASIVGPTGESPEPQQKELLARRILITWSDERWSMYEMAP